MRDIAVIERETERQRERETDSLAQLLGFLLIPHLAKSDPFQNPPWKPAGGWSPSSGFTHSAVRTEQAGCWGRAQSRGCGRHPNSSSWCLCSAFTSTIRLGSPHKELPHLCTQNLDIGLRILNLTENLQPGYFSKCMPIFLRCVGMFLSITGLI